MSEVILTLLTRCELKSMAEHKCMKTLHEKGKIKKH